MDEIVPAVITSHTAAVNDTEQGQSAGCRVHIGCINKMTCHTVLAKGYKKKQKVPLNCMCTKILIRSIEDVYKKP